MNCIFSLYIEIPDDQLDLTLGPYPGSDVERELKAREIYTKWLPTLTENKKEYCEKHGSTLSSSDMMMPLLSSLSIIRIILCTM